MVARDPPGAAHGGHRADPIRPTGRQCCSGERPFALHLYYFSSLPMPRKADLSKTDLPEPSVEDVLDAKGTLDAPSTVLTAAPSDSVYDCIGRMVEQEIGSLVVVENDEIAGIFTERDYMRKVELEGRRSQETPVRVVMTENVETVTPDRSLDDCVDLMQSLRCRHLPVVDAEGRLSDMISMRDCMQQLTETAKSKALQLIGRMQEKYPVPMHG
jgi:CBS domain-containing protein